ncbi:hypothetical protein BD626DRAFT_520778 [Schizophyllum amplum]|uniref:Uncharacterized protein n=1 Tax=Schizophyllum amplum TaxID=97359 RepID=A0A550BU66_9AGAR|nr:hypothetical protein BD626DRAFT_520778 [Auriculariopsis ampla]
MRITLHRYLFNLAIHLVKSSGNCPPTLLYATCSSSGVYRPRLRPDSTRHRRSCGRGAAATAYAIRRTRIVPSPLRRRMRHLIERAAHAVGRGAARAPFSSSMRGYPHKGFLFPRKPTALYAVGPFQNASELSSIQRPLHKLRKLLYEGATVVVRQLED